MYQLTLFLFSVLALGVAFLRLRWAVLCMLLSTGVDVIGPRFTSASSVGWQNAVVTLVLPTLLLLRMTRFHIPRIRWRFPARAWVALVLYAAISTLWSPFKLSGLKMVGYLVAWFLLYLVFHVAWKRGLLDTGLVIAALWASMGLACVQTYLLGNPEEAGTHQFTSFTPASSFAIFLSCILAILIFRRRTSPLYMASAAACFIGIVLAGDRTSLIGLGLLLFVWLLFWRRVIGTAAGLRFAPAVPALLLCLLLFLGFRATMAWAMPQSRLNQLIDLGSQRTPDIQDIGTAAWRLEMYQKAISRISQRKLRGLLLGSGTSSGGALAFTWQKDLPNGVDPNRTLHSGLLRVIYEWGLVGTSLVLALGYLLVSTAWRLAVRDGSAGAIALLAMLPATLVLSSVGDPLPFPASAMGIGLLLVMTRGLSNSFRDRADQPRPSMSSRQSEGAA